MIEGKKVKEKRRKIVMTCSRDNGEEDEGGKMLKRWKE